MVARNWLLRSLSAMAISGHFSLAQDAAHGVDRVASQQFNIRSHIDDGGGNMLSVALWYTVDGGTHWRHYGTWPATDEAIPFSAYQEGLFGFHVVATNEHGASGLPPQGASAAQHWVHVDYTPPVVQLHPVQLVDDSGGQRLVRLRWAVIDEALPDKPVTIQRRSADGGDWVELATELPPSGSYDWALADHESGVFEFRIMVKDLGGHQVVATTDALAVPARTSIPVSMSFTGDTESALTTGIDDARSAFQPADRSQEAKALYHQGLSHSLRREYRMAASRLREALTLDAGMTVALVELGRVLYAQRRLEDSMDAYRLALGQDSNQRDALEGLALALIAQRRFPEAAEHLQRIVDANPRDVATWLNLGDVAIYQGQELLAGEYYQRAATSNPADGAVVEKARLRLSELKKLATEFRQNEAVR